MHEEYSNRRKAGQPASYQQATWAELMQAQNYQLIFDWQPACGVNLLKGFRHTC